jgi:PII-like signaling protein
VIHLNVSWFEMFDLSFDIIILLGHVDDERMIGRNVELIDECFEKQVEYTVNLFLI